MNKVQHRNARSTNKAPSRRHLVSGSRPTVCTPSASDALDVIRKATPEALDLAYHTLACEVCAAAEAETPVYLEKFCPKGQSLFRTAALRAGADRRRAARAAMAPAGEVQP